VWFIELASLSSVATDVTALCATIVQLLHMNASSGADAKALASALKPLHMVLVFDNAEHLLEPISSLIATLLAGTTSLRIVVTSQEPLHIADEQVYRLAPLSLPAVADDGDEDRLMDSSAVQLFVQRVSARLHGFALAPQQQQTVAEICRALDGMPLAIELAAARVPLLGVRGIADLLLDDEHDTRLQLLTGGARTATLRQRSLRNAMEWSYRLLDESQQRIFRRLGVFRGGFTLVEAQAVCSDERVDAWSVLDALDALVDKSLIESFDVGGQRRFRLLESLRAFALERLVDAGEDEATRDRHLQAVLDYWKTADTRALDEPALAWAEPHRVEIDNLRTALRWADQHGHDAELIELVASSMLLWCRAGLGAEGYAWCARAQARVATIDDRVLLCRLDLAIATLALYFGAYSLIEGMQAAERAADGLIGAGDTVRAYFALYIVFQSNVREQNVFDRAALLQKMSELERPDWNDVRRRFLRSARNYDRRLAGDATGYLEACRHELALCRSIGAVAEGWIAAQGLMLAEHDVGRVDEAIAVATESIDEIRAAGRLRQHPNFIALWATMLAEQGLTVRARAALVEALPILRSSGTPWMAHVALAWLAMHEGRNEDAARVIGHHAAMLRAGRAAESGAYIARSLKELSERLTERIGVDAFERGRDAGSSLDDLQAERLALGSTT
jgi:predicted ATPase